MVFDECMRYNLTVNQNACIGEHLASLWPYAFVLLIGFVMGAFGMAMWYHNNKGE